MREMEMVGGMKNENEGTMLHVSNLNLNVTHEDIKVKLIRSERRKGEKGSGE